MKFLTTLLLGMCIAVVSHAADRDTLFAAADADGWSIHHLVRQGETIFSLSRRYHAPPSILAETNGKTYSDGLAVGMRCIVPLGPYNLLSAVPANADEARPLYYRYANGDNLGRIARRTGASKTMLMQWNGLQSEAVPTNKPLLVAWVKYDATPVTPEIQTQVAAPKPPVIVVKQDTPKYVLQAPADTPAASTTIAPVAKSAFAQLWQEQTDSGRNVKSERGSAGFYATGPDAARFAFYNMAARGAILQVKNLNNGQIIFVKVLGPVPVTKAFAGCVLGLSMAAKNALHVHEQRAFCEITYAGY